MGKSIFEPKAAYYGRCTGAYGGKQTIFFYFGIIKSTLKVCVGLPI